MRWIKTSVVFVVVLAIGAYIYFYERKTPTTEERKEKAKKVFDFKSEDVKKLSLKKGEQLIACEKREGKWQMVKPLNVKADKGKIERILSRLEFLQTERRLKKEKDKQLSLEDFGLDKPRMETTFEIDDKSFTLLLGDNCAVGANMYVMRKDKEEVLLVTKTLPNDLDKRVEDLRDRQVIEVDKYNVTKLLIEREGKEFECKKEGEKWRITNPVLARCDSDKIEEIFAKLDDLKVENFVSEEPSDADKLGLLSPAVSVTVWEENISRSVIFGEEEKDKVYAKRKAFNSIYSVKKDIIKTLFKEPNELRDRKVIRFEADKVKRIELSALGKIVLEKEGDDWEIAKPKEMKADTWEVEDFLREMEDLEIEEFAEEECEKLDKYGLEEPQATVTLIVKEPEEKQKILLGKKKDSDYCYLKREDENPVFTVSVDFLEKVKRDYLAYREREILSFSTSDVKKLILEREGKKYLCERDSENKWKLTEPPRAEINSSIIDDILWGISSLDAQKFVAESAKNLGKFGLAEPQIKLTVGMEKEEGKPVTETLLIGNQTDGDTFFAKLQRKEEIFEVQNSIVENLKKDLGKTPEPPEEAKEGE